MNNMEKDLNLPKLAIGTWAWGDVGNKETSYFGKNYNTETLRSVYKTALKNGLNLFDTATVYGNGKSEEVLGNFIKDSNRKDVIISTKFTPQIAVGENAMKTMVKESENRLKTNDLDIYWIHNPENVDKWTKELIPLIKSNNIKYVGVSNHNLSEIKQAQSILQKAGLSLSAVQNHFSILDRSSEKNGILDYCHENNIIFFSYMVLEQGILTGKYNIDNPLPDYSERGKIFNPILNKIEPIISELDKISKKYEATISQIAISWAIGKNTLPIIGATKEQQIISDVRATKINLSKDEINSLDKISSNLDINTKQSWEASIK